MKGGRKAASCPVIHCRHRKGTNSADQSTRFGGDFNRERRHEFGSEHRQGPHPRIRSVIPPAPARTSPRRNQESGRQPRLLPTRTTESPGASIRPGEIVGLADLRSLEPGEHQLGYPLTAPNPHDLGSGILEQDPDLSAVVRIDGSRAVGERDAVPGCQPRARPDLALEAWGKLHEKACGHPSDLPLKELKIRLCGTDVVPGSMGGRPGRQWEVRVGVKAEEPHLQDTPRLHLAHGWEPLTHRDPAGEEGAPPAQSAGPPHRPPAPW
jgi:hypothetical protein